MSPAMMSYNLFNNTQKPGFDNEAGSDLASFLDLSFTESSALPLPTPTLFPSSAAPAPAFSNAFANNLRQEDALLESPLGLSPASLSASPFDFSQDFTSPLLSGAFGTPDSLDGMPGTPDFGYDEYPSLFGNVAAPGSTTWAPSDLSSAMQAPIIAPASVAVSPSLMSLDTELPPLPAAPAPKVTATRKKTAKEIEAEDAASRQAVKDKFTGTRNTKIKPIDFDAPTLPKNYLLPSATSRKRAPTAIASKITGATGKGNKRARRDSTPLVSEGEMLNPDEIPDELLSAIELKRRQNTLAARRSRMRKAGHLAELQATIEERDARIASLEDELLALKQRLGEA